MTVASDRQGFMEAILTNPDDDSVRLIFADWLEENGEGERAEFIRVQIALVSDLVPEGWEDTEMVLRRRERELLGAHFGEWTNQLPESLVTRECPNCIDQAPDWETNVIECRRCESTGVIPDEDNVEFRRGFVEALTCTAADWLKYADKLVWRPGQKCPECMGGQRRNTYTGEPPVCRDCDGTGLRPCPPTAQPIREVRLTTRPELVSDGAGPWMLGGRPVRDPYAPFVAILAAEWPGIDFTLPETHP